MSDRRRHQGAGPVYIGDNARIGAGSVVLKNLPANCTAVGVPAEVVRINNKAINPADDLDQQDLPDIMAQRLVDLDRRIGQLEKAAQGDIPPRPSRWPHGSAGGKLPPPIAPSQRPRHLFWA